MFKYRIIIIFAVFALGPANIGLGQGADSSTLKANLLSGDPLKAKQAAYFLAEDLMLSPMVDHENLNLGHYGLKMANMNNDVITKAFVAVLQDRSFEYRQGAIRFLELINPKQFAKEFNKALKTDPDPQVRSRAIDALRRAGESDFILTAIRKAMEDENPNVRSNAAICLGVMGDLESVPLLIGKFEKPFVDLLPEAELVGAAIGMEQLAKKKHLVCDGLTCELLRSALDHKEGDVRTQVALALGMLQDRDAIPRLRRMLLKDEDEGARRCAAIALGRLKAVSAIPDLTKALRDRSGWEVCVPAAEALMYIDPQKACPIITEALEKVVDSRCQRSFRYLLQTERTYLFD